MSAAPRTNLAIIMKKLYISGNDLANGIFVNYSLVSKWKTGSRNLIPDSENLKKTATFLLQIDEKNDSHQIKKLLSIFYDESSINSYEKLHTVLCAFLCTSYQPDLIQKEMPSTPTIPNSLSHTSLCRIYHTNAGLRAAALQFLAMATEMPPGQELLMLNQMDISWLTEDASFLPIWNKHFQQTLKAGQKFKMIHWMDAQTDKLSKIVVNWLPLTFIDGIETWYFPQYVECPINSALMVIRNNFAVSSTSPRSLLQDTVSMLYNDASIANYYGEIFDSVLSECKPLTDIFNDSRNEKLIKKLVSVSNTQTPTYFFTDAPPLSVLATSEIKDILQTNHINNAQIQICLDYYSKTQIMDKNTTRICLDLSNYKTDTNIRRFCSAELSALLGTPIYLNVQQQKRLLDAFIELISNNSSQDKIALVEEKTEVPAASILIKQNIIAAAWPSDNRCKSISTNESTVVNAFYHHCDHFWHAIPRVNKSSAYLIHRLQELFTFNQVV